MLQQEREERDGVVEIRSKGSERRGMAWWRLGVKKARYYRRKIIDCGETADWRTSLKKLLNYHEGFIIKKIIMWSLRGTD
jgi:hypothetical protein